MTRIYHSLTPAYPKSASGRFTQKLCVGCKRVRYMPSKWRLCADCSAREMLSEEAKS